MQKKQLRCFKNIAALKHPNRQIPICRIDNAHYFWSFLPTPILLLVALSQQRNLICLLEKSGVLRDAILTERDAHCVDAGFARDARLRRVCGTHRITYHSAAVSLITYYRTLYIQMAGSP